MCFSHRYYHACAFAGLEQKVLSINYSGKRFIPTVPTLPNGLKDAFQNQSVISNTDASGSKQPGMIILYVKHCCLVLPILCLVDALLNPCHCKDVYKCKCRAQDRPCGSVYSVSGGPVDPAIFNDGLSALALVAACCSPASVAPLPSSLPSQSNFQASNKPNSIEAISGEAGSLDVTPQVDNVNLNKAKATKRKRSSPSPPTQHRKLPIISPPTNVSSGVSSTSYRKIAPAYSPPAITENVPSSSVPGSLPPILPNPPLPFTSTSSANTEASNTHDISQSDPGCCCGTRCECAGCSLHGPALPEQSSSWIDDSVDYMLDLSNPPTATKASEASAHTDCGVDCPTCVDHTGGIELPRASSIRSSQSADEISPSPALAAFLARAAALPPPPAAPRSSLDPMNVTIFPGLLRRSRSRTIDDNEGRTDKRASSAFDDELPLAYGLVQIPKLEECCDGRCGCPENACSCGDACGGCCMDSEEGIDKEESGVKDQKHNSLALVTNLPVPSSSSTSSHVSSPPTGGCCSSA